MSRDTEQSREFQLYLYMYLKMPTAPQGLIYFFVDCSNDSDIDLLPSIYTQFVLR